MTTSPGGAESARAAAERFPCPKCGAGLAYDPAVRGLRCPFCGETRTIDAGGKVLEKDLREALEAAALARGGPAAPAGERRATCESCGAEVLVPPTERAGRCAYCGSPKVLEEDARDRGRIAPQCLVPFAVDRVKAETLFRAWVRSLWFRPNALKRAHALGEMRGVLVPFWTFDATAESRWTAMAGHHYYVTVGSGKNRRTVRQTRWVPASGARRDRWDDLLVCASRGLDPGLLARIEPFELSALVPFRTEYLAGWSAEAYAVDVKEAWGTGERRIREGQQSRCAGDVPGDTHRDLSVNTTLSELRYRHALLPVWVAAYSFRGKVFRFLVNGQTGEVQGEAPWSWVKITLLVLGILGLVGLGILLANA
ncbi:MAG: primosomal protein N' (replication factor Y) - superfamily II helicase [Planctomycetes bacterium]|nr:primosomal protein N' (replication factor Y) - superfamily II helicase [Planctomycetota bacterium]